MDFTIEREFFSIFEEGGSAYKCLNLLKSKHNLQTYTDKKQSFTPYDKDTIDQMERQLIDNNSVFSDLIYDMYELLGLTDDGNVDSRDCLLFNEIRDNLTECQNDKSKMDRYILSLLSPFGKWCEVETIEALISRIDKDIEECRKSSTIRQDLVSSNEEYRQKIKQQYENEIALLEKEKDRTCDIYGEFLVIKSGDNPMDTPEGLYINFNDLVSYYSRELDLVLLTLGINILRLEHECRIYFFDDGRDFGYLAERLGSQELVNKYIEMLPEEEKYPCDSASKLTQSDKTLSIPAELNTPKAKEIFTKAINIGIMSENNGAYNWLGTNRECAYFAACFNTHIWNKDKLKRNLKEKRFQFRWSPFHKVFDKKNLGQDYNDITFEEVEYPRIDAIFSN